MSGAVVWRLSGARPRHLRVRRVWLAALSFSAAKGVENIEMTANVSVFRLCFGVVRPCGCCSYLHSGRPVAFLPGSCPVPARFLCPTAGQHPPRSGGCCAARSRAATGRTILTRVLDHACADGMLPTFPVRFEAPNGDRTVILIQSKHPPVSAYHSFGVSLIFDEGHDNTNIDFF